MTIIPRRLIGRCALALTLAIATLCPQAHPAQYITTSTGFNPILTGNSPHTEGLRGTTTHTTTKRTQAAIQRAELNEGNPTEEERSTKDAHSRHSDQPSSESAYTHATSDSVTTQDTTIAAQTLHNENNSTAKDSIASLPSSSLTPLNDSASDTTPPSPKTQLLEYRSPKRCIIKDITVDGIRYIDHSIILNLTGLRKGDTIDIPGPATTRAVKKLWSQNLFSDVKLYLDHQEGDYVSLRFKLREQPRISQITYEGPKRSDRKELEEKVPIRIGQQATPSTIDAAKRVILKHYLDKGYLNTSVDARLVADTLTVNTVKLTFLVDRKKKVKVKSITFHGNDAFTDKKLRKKGFKDTKIKNLNFFRSSKFVDEKYRADLGNLIDFYNKHGYRDAAVIWDTVKQINEKRVTIDVGVNEGPQYHIREIRWVGNTKYDAEALQRTLGMKPGDVYDKELLNKRLTIDENSITTAYMDEGYLFFNITPVETDIKNDSVTLEMRIFEGPQATISSVEIEGNTRTSDHVIRRELRTLPGDLFSRSNITRSFRELANLGFFNPETFNIIPMPNPADGTVKLKYIVEEKSSDQLEMSAGWGAGMFIGSIGVRFGNFSLGRLFDKESWKPIPSGDGQTLSLRATTNGRQYRSISFTFIEPWLGGKKPNNFQVSIYHSVYDYSKFLFRPTDDYFKITGGSIGYGTRLKWPDDYFVIFTDLQYQNYLLRNWKHEFLFTDGMANNLSIRFTLSRNSIDQPIYPRTGSNFSISLQITPPYSLMNGKNYADPAMTPQQRYRWIEYHKWTARAQWFVPIAGDFVFYFNAQFGVLGRFNHDYGYSPFEGFDLGGDGMTNQNFLYGRETIGLRGYSNGSLTPVLPNGVRMANIYNKFAIEFRYPIVLQAQYAVYLLAFAEAGNAWYEINEFNPFQLYRSTGVGFRVFLPMVGMIGFDLGYGFDRVPHAPGAHKWQPHVIIGMPF